MTDEQLKRVISANRRPKEYFVGDMVRVREPDARENNSVWGAHAYRLGQVGKVVHGGKNNNDGTVRVNFDANPNPQGSALRGQWVELVFEGEHDE